MKQGYASSTDQQQHKHYESAGFNNYRADLTKYVKGTETIKGIRDERQQPAEHVNSSIIPVPS